MSLCWVTNVRTTAVSVLLSFVFYVESIVSVSVTPLNCCDSLYRAPVSVYPGASLRTCIFLAAFLSSSLPTSAPSDALPVPTVFINQQAIGRGAAAAEAEVAAYLQACASLPTSSSSSLPSPSSDDDEDNEDELNPSDSGGILQGGGSNSTNTSISSNISSSNSGVASVISQGEKVPPPPYSASRLLLPLQQQQQQQQAPSLRDAARAAVRALLGALEKDEDGEDDERIDIAGGENKGESSHDRTKIAAGGYHVALDRVEVAVVEAETSQEGPASQGGFRVLSTAEARSLLFDN
jgi:hypothetical protein